MTTSGQVRDAIVARLKVAGLDAIPAYEEERFRERSASVISVGARQTELTKAGMLDYLGERYDAELGCMAEVYGRRLLLTAAVDIYAPRRRGRAAASRPPRPRRRRC